METVDMEHTNQPYAQHDTSFDVVAAFSGLETNRKMTLFDQLMCGRANAYRNTIKSIWPQSNDNDARKLEIILRARLDRLKKFS
jgi:hypothetical protein